MDKYEYFRTRYSLILSYLGMILCFSGLLMLVPLIYALFQPGGAAEIFAFLPPAGILILAGYAFWRWLRPAEDSEIVLDLRDGGVIVLLSWVIVCLVSAWPFQVSSGFDFTRSIFESVSGWTTTGLSVVNTEKVSRAILLWRSTMQVAGGAGFAIIMLSAITGPSGYAISSAEGRSQQLVPHVRRSAKLVLLIYSGSVIVGIAAYRLGGMSLFDAVNHSFTALSTGGFSTHNESIGYWDSAAIEAVTMILMILGNLNFVTSWLLLRGKFALVGKDGEIRVMALLIPVSFALVLLLTSLQLYPTVGESIRVAAFETVTALTTTGFSTVGYTNWNSIGVFVLICLMLIGGGTCSTAGGIKQFRIYALYKGLLWEIRQAFLPKRSVNANALWSGEQKVFVSDGQLKQIGSYLFIYLTVYLIGVGIVAAYGYTLQEAFFEFASALGTVGLSIGVTSYKAPGAVLWAETAGMFLGRLEFMVVIVGLATMLKDLRGIMFRRRT
ncbi:MAG: cation transporter [Candidatus Glassbacteria bacterium RIFCSPLOWO2_12_FULL_58_11]|uniref:Cation transporter n=1 Tax=Candidatus Glassbacteria bacterium RIFCSPLOWO2_12_FULL_58_11 TaxID=1817867 RepID=A0A1F5YMI8_9BACT|nr:MAG: cation transporter [Candidatus Glassbacteria bacterium RIFCSPLOWO2_12_FULL_58_11]